MERIHIIIISANKPTTIRLVTSGFRKAVITSLYIPTNICTYIYPQERYIIQDKSTM